MHSPHSIIYWYGKRFRQIYFQLLLQVKISSKRCSFSVCDFICLQKRFINLWHLSHFQYICNGKLAIQSHGVMILCSYPYSNKRIILTLPVFTFKSYTAAFLFFFLLFFVFLTKYFTCSIIWLPCQFWACGLVLLSFDWTVLRHSLRSFKALWFRFAALSERPLSFKFCTSRGGCCSTCISLLWFSAGSGAFLSSAMQLFHKKTNK